MTSIWTSWRHYGSHVAALISDWLASQTKQALKSPKMVWFWWSKRLGPLKRGSPTHWNSYFGDRMIRNALFRLLTHESNGCYGNQYDKLLSWPAPDLSAKFGRNRLTNPGVDSKRTNRRTNPNYSMISPSRRGLSIIGNYHWKSLLNTWRIAT